MTDKPKGWKETTLGEVAEINSTESLSKGKIAKYVAMENISPFTRQVSKFAMKAYNGGMKFRNGDTLLARITPCLENGKTSYVNFLNHDEVGFGSTEFIVIREKEGSSDEKFLYYLAISPRFREIAIKSMTGTSGRQRVQIDLLVGENQILFPPLPEQRAIAAVLSSLDDKIELLREQNKTLEATAEAIFKEWFAAPSSKGTLSNGWREGRMGDVVEVFDSKRVPLASNVRAKRRGSYPYYGATEIMDWIDDYLFDGTYLLLAEDGSVMDAKGYVVLQYVTGKIWVNNHAHVLQGKDDFSTEILYLFCKQLKAAGITTGAVQPKINQENLLSVDLVIPDKDVLIKLNKTIQPMFQKIISNNSQIQTLSKLRDALLPKLMSGEIRL